jgi:hypothetical protein
MNTWQEVLDGDITLDEYIYALAKQAVDKDTALHALVDKTVSQIQTDTKTAEERVAELEFEKLVQQNALMGGVLPKAVHHIAASAAELFELRDGMLRVKNGETNPNDPLTPLTFDVWLKEFRKDHDFLFAKGTGIPSSQVGP